tara:strand:- start:84 stop:254 length:171 start_codon:yes stop_codon:yes gene_type:complete
MRIRGSLLEETPLMAVRGAQIPRNYYRRSADLINGDAEIFSAGNKLDNNILINKIA